MSRRHGLDGDNINFYEWMFVRTVAVAWSISTGERSAINREELIDIALKVTPSFTTYEKDLKNVIYNAIDFMDTETSYDFLETLNVLHAFAVF